MLKIFVKLHERFIQRFNTFIVFFSNSYQFIVLRYIYIYIIKNRKILKITFIIIHIKYI